MPIFLSHTTATECWRSGRFDALLGGPSISKRHRPAGSIQVEDTASILAMDRLDVTYREALAFGSVREGEALACKPSAREVRELRTGAIVFTSDPTHLLVPGKRAAATIRSASCHVRSDALPGGSFVRVSDGLLLCSPELCFLQMASRVSFLKLVKLGHELCALYTLQPDGRAGYERVLPPTTVRALEAYLRRCEGMAGCSVASKALRYIAVASGSPMETALAIVLCLPLRLGGYGLPLPRMNYRIEARRGSRGTSDKRYYLCDLFWPEANVAIEYDSDLEHTGSARIAHQVGAMLNVRIRDERGWNPREREQLLRSLVTEHDLKASWTKARRISVSN